jgi:hypothetical protein
VLGTAFPVESAGEKCECFVHHGQRHVYLLFISYIVYSSSWAFIKIKIQNYAQNFPPQDSCYYVTMNLSFTPEVQDYAFSTVCICYGAWGGVVVKALRY